MNKTKEIVRAAVKVWAERPDWYVYSLGDWPTPDDYIRAFAVAMDVLVAYSQGTEGDKQLGLGLAFASTEAGAACSYRRVLKKYSRSPIFADLQIHLLLVLEDDSVMHLLPEQVNPFLIDLNRYIKGLQASRA